MVKFHNTSYKRDGEGNLIEFKAITGGGTHLLFKPDDIEKRVGMSGLSLKNLLNVLAVQVSGSDIGEIIMSDFHHVLYRGTKDEAYLYNSEGKRVHTFQLGGQ